MSALCYIAPMELRLYDSVDVVRYKYQGPTESPDRYNKLKADILENGVRNPLIMRWDIPARDFRPIVGNNRVAVLHDLGETDARALFLGPDDARWPDGDYEVLLFNRYLEGKLNILWAGDGKPWHALTELSPYVTQRS